MTLLTKTPTSHMRWRLRPWHLAGLAALAPILAMTSDAEACGGCFTTQPSVVTGHRMAFSISPQQTVLWDQIQYSGEPEDFAWVLPVKPGAVVEASTDAWFEALEAGTVVSISPPPTTGCGSSGGCLFGATTASDESGAFAPSSNGGVQIVHQGTVGPYETVTLATDTAGVLNDWLEDHGYGVDPTTQPVIDAYVEEGFDFIALRLQPGKDVRAMTPVRIVMPGATPELPLRMIAAGSGPTVSLILFVIGEGRYETDNFPSVLVPTELVSWDFSNQSSNYGELRTGALADSGGRGWLTAFAKRDPFFSFDTSSFGFTAPISDLYVSQALSNGEASMPCQIANLAGASDVVVDTCDGVEEGEPCATPAGDEIELSSIVCEGLTDLGVALLGQHPSDVWVTRLEAELARDALGEDLVLRAAPQIPVDNLIQARVGLNEEELCGTAWPTLRTPREVPPSLRATGALIGIMASALAAFALLLRRRRPLTRA